MKKIVLFIAALSLFVSSPLLAAQMQTFKSGSKLLNECSPLFSQNKSKIECGRPVEKLKEKNYFFKMKDKKEWLVKYIEDNPDRVNITASSLILPALSEAYPCPSASQPEK